jgi:DNA-binding MarR family transcriptional regulator
LGHKTNRFKRSARVARAPGSRETSARKGIAKAPAVSLNDPIALGDLSSNLGYRMRRAQLWVFKEVSRRLAPFESSAAQFSVLTIIHANPGINQLTIASALSIERAGLGRLVDRLEQQGLVVRTGSSANRRYYVLHLTAAGAALLNRLTPIIAQCEKALAKKLGSRTYEELLRTLSIFLHE